MRLLLTFMTLWVFALTPLAEAQPECQGELCEQSAKLRSAYEVIAEYYLTLAETGVSRYGVEYSSDYDPERLGACVTTCRGQLYSRMNVCDRVVDEMPPEDFLDQTFKIACYENAVNKVVECVGLVEINSCVKGNEPAMRGAGQRNPADGPSE